MEEAEELTMALADMQHSVNGLVMGAPTVYWLDDVTGMGLGPKDSKKYAIGGARGHRWGREWRRGNLVVFEGAIVCPGDPAAAYAALTALRTAFAADNIEGVPNATVNWLYKMPGAAETTVPGRPTALEVSLKELRIGLVPFQGTFDCKTPVTV